MAAEQRDFDEFLDKFRKHRDIMTEELHKVIVGQDTVIEQILAAILPSTFRKPAGSLEF